MILFTFMEYMLDVLCLTLCTPSTLFTWKNLRLYFLQKSKKFLLIAYFITHWNKYLIGCPIADIFKNINLNTDFSGSFFNVETGKNLKFWVRHRLHFQHGPFWKTVKLPINCRGCVIFFIYHIPTEFIFRHIMAFYCLSYPFFWLYEK